MENKDIIHESMQIPKGHISKYNKETKEFYTIPYWQDEEECALMKKNIMTSIRDRKLKLYDLYRIGVISGDIEGTLPFPEFLLRWRRDLLDMVDKAIVHTPQELIVAELKDEGIDELLENLKLFCNIDYKDILKEEE